MKVKKIATALLALTLCVSVVGCSKKGKKSGDAETKQVPISAGYLEDEVNYRAAKIVAEKYKIDLSSDKLKAFVNSNYGNEKVSDATDLLTTKTALEAVVGEDKSLESYAQLYVEQELRNVLAEQEGQMTPEEIEEYKVNYKDYLDRIGIPEDQRAEYVKTLKDTYVIQEKITGEWDKAVKSATLDVFNEYAPEYLKSTGMVKDK